MEMRRPLTLVLAAALAALAFAVLACGALAEPAPAAPGFGRLIAPTGACPGQGDLGAPAARQERTMRCMVNYARARGGLRALRRSRRLDRSAGRKSGDMLRCDDFSHEACGREFTYWMERVGFIGRDQCWRAAENIAWGSGRLGTVRSIFTAWINSEGHRENILGRFGWIGVGLRAGELEGFSGAHVWTQHFATIC